jgi:hypothetical protein
MFFFAENNIEKPIYWKINFMKLSYCIPKFGTSIVAGLYKQEQLHRKAA